MNGIDPQKNHIRWITGCITLLGLGASVGGTILIYKGYNGDLLIGGALASISGLCGFLGAGRPNAPQPDISVSGQPPVVSVTQRPKQEEQPSEPQP